MKQGEVWLINLDPTIGSEIKKTRPAIIVNDDLLGKLPLRIIVPLTDWKDRYDIAPWMIKIEASSNNGLNKTSSVDCFQVRSVSSERFVKRLGRIKLESMEEVRVGLSKVLSIDIK
ncbi:MAG: PemK family transcriptional regulator [Bacteroidetes bacterium GWA2_31_9]|nr:MAG: PemK family transcriptional regulator [Bacteroidetes bacterium GWA2_31_9]